MAYASLEQVAQVLKMTPQMVNRHVKVSGMPRISRGEYDLIKCVHWYIDFKDRQIKEARQGTETESQARQRLVVATADLREVELARACGDLIELEVARKLWERLVLAFKNKMLLLPTKVAPVVLALKESNEVRELLDEEVQEALKELSHEAIDTSAIRRSGAVSRIRREARRAAAKAHGKRVGRPTPNAQRGKLS